MEVDAFDAGVAYGGLRSQREIRLIVCYLLANIKKEVKKEHIVNALTEGAIANYFEVSSVITDLLNHHNIEEHNGALTLTDDSRDAIDELETELPLTIREKAIALCTKLVIQERYQQENKVEITPTGNGYYVNCHVMASDTEDMLSFRLYVGSITQAETVKEKFLQNPVRVYDHLIDSMFQA